MEGDYFSPNCLFLSLIQTLILSCFNFKMQVEHAVREIKRLLIEASAAALQAEMRNPTATSGRYSVV